MIDDNSQLVFGSYWEIVLVTLDFVAAANPLIFCQQNRLAAIRLNSYALFIEILVTGYIVTHC